MNKNIIKFICLFLCVVISISCSVTVSAVSLNRSENEENTVDDQTGDDDSVLDSHTSEGIELYHVSPEELGLVGPGEKGINELADMKVDQSSIPSFVPMSTALRVGHVNRLRAQEKTPNIVTYQNRDGTKTTYIYNRPVKYVTGDGVVADKNCSISKIADQTYDYAVLDNNVNIYFPRSMSKGILLAYDKYEISLSSASSQKLTHPAYDAETNSIIYSNVVAENTFLLYAPNLSGYEGSIVMYQDIGTPEFNFELTAMDLVVKNVNNQWCFLSENGDTVAYLSNITVTDSSNRTMYGDIKISRTNQKGKYSVTISIPENFANDSSIQYPLYVDYGMYIDADYETEAYYRSSGQFYLSYNTITDVGICEDINDYLAANNQSTNPDKLLVVGETDRGVCKVAYKFYDFYGDGGLFAGCTADQISSAYLHIMTTNSSVGVIYANPMTSSWTTIYGSIALYDENLLESYSANNESSSNVNHLNVGEVSINITQIVKGWANYNSGESNYNYDNPNNGILLSFDQPTPSSSTPKIKIRSTTSTGNYHIFVEVHTTDIDGGDEEFDYSGLGEKCYINGLWYEAYLTPMTYDTPVLRSFDENKDWDVTYIGYNEYLISYSTFGLEDSGDDISLSHMPYDPPIRFRWYILSDGTQHGYYIKNAETGKFLKQEKYDYDDDDGEISRDDISYNNEQGYKRLRWRLIKKSEHCKLQSFVAQCSEWMDVGDVLTPYIVTNPINVTFWERDSFIWNSTNESVATVSSQGVISAISEGTTRIIAKHKSTLTVYSFMIAVGQIIPTEDIYYVIQSRHSSRLADVSTPMINGLYFVEQTDFTGYMPDQWTLEYCGDGYYTIESLAFEQYLGVRNANPLPQEYIVLLPSVGDECKWKILPTLYGGYKLIPKSGESTGMSLCVYGEDWSGCSLWQYEYVADFDYTDEWILLDADTMFTSDTGIVNEEIVNIMNVSSGYNMSVENSSNVNFSNVITCTPNDSSIQQWELNKIAGTNRSYRIISCNGDAGKVLDVTGTNVDIYSNLNISCQEFEIRRLNFAPYQGCYVIMQDGDYVVQDDSFNIVMSSDFSSAAVWSISSINKYGAYLMSFNYQSPNGRVFNTTKNNDIFTSKFSSMGYDAHIRVNHNAIDAINDVVSDASVFIFNGHGASGLIAFHDNEGWPSGCICSGQSPQSYSGSYVYIGNLEDDALSNLRCVIYDGCQTAMYHTPEESLLEATYNRGAHFVTGNIDTVYVGDSNRFLEGFLLSFGSIDNPDCNILKAIYAGIVRAGLSVDYPTYGVTGAFPITYLGDQYQNLY